MCFSDSLEHSEHSRSDYHEKTSGAQNCEGSGTGADLGCAAAVQHGEQRFREDGGSDAKKGGE